VRVEVEHEVRGERPLHRLAPQRAGRPAQHGEHDALRLRHDALREVLGDHVAQIDEGVAERPPGGLGLAHRRPELGLGDPPRPVEARPEPVLLDGRGGEDDGAVHEVEPLGDLPLGQGQDAGPALGPGADDLLRDEHPGQVEGAHEQPCCT
jgi:hypothetical protein